jgi:hypothetical protein
MQVDKWTTQGGAANNSNQMFFKFGGVVGFTNTIADYKTWPGASAVKFNPVTGAPSYANYGAIPYWNGTDTTDGYISSDAYHTLANILAGRGDPCKLVGLPVAQIQAGTIDNLTYRMPTHAENYAEYSSVIFEEGNGWVTGTTPTAGIHAGNIDTSFLPASGLRQANGNASLGSSGLWWLSRAHSIENGCDFIFSNGSSSLFGNAIATGGRPVRCVPQS